MKKIKKLTYEQIMKQVETTVKASDEKRAKKEKKKCK